MSYSIQDQLATISEEIKVLEQAKNPIKKASELLVQLESLRSSITDHNLLVKFCDMSMQLGMMLIPDLQSLRDSATQYFERLFLENTKRIRKSTFLPKSAGDQLGAIMQIDYIDSQPASTLQTIQYFIKTHQYSRRGRGGMTRPVDPKELLVYKVLAYTGYGPKVHFFWNSPSPDDFYIATQDAAFTKITDKEKEFRVYEHVHKEHEAIDFNAVPEVAKTFLCCFDLISRILRLRDVMTNRENFGRVLTNRNEKWKIIDFRVDTSGSYVYDDIFQGFLEGNGMSNYSGFLGRLLRDTAQLERVMRARKVKDMLLQGQPCLSREGVKMDFMRAVRIADEEIRSFVLANLHVLGFGTQSPALALEDLRRYVAAIEDNFFIIQKSLEVYPARIKITTV